MKRKSREQIFLIGSENEQILGAKLPSNRQVLSVLFYNMRNVYNNIDESATLVAKEVFLFWEKSSIPVQKMCRVRSKIKKLHSDWRDLSKNKNRKSETQRQHEHSFTESLDDLFDIAHENAEQLIKSEETKQFLIAQRKHGREGCLLGNDQKLMQKEKRVAERLEKEEMRKRKYVEQQKCDSK